MTNHAASKPSDHAGVRVPPPLIYVVLFGLGLILHQIVPIAFLPNMPARAAALIFISAGVLLAGWSNVRVEARSYQPGADQAEHGAGGAWPLPADAQPDVPGIVVRVYRTGALV